MSGYITYIEYQYASNKGGTKQGDFISSFKGFGDVDADFTGGRVVETVKVDADGKATLAWAPVFVTTDEKALSANAAVVGVEGATVTVLDADKGEIQITADGLAEGAEYRVRYVYNNIVVPQNDLPMIKAEMKSIALVAKARRIAVYYSQIAAYQAKTDYGVDLGDQLAEKAVGELSYEIDTEITNMLVEHAKKDDELVWSKTLPIGVNQLIAA